MKSKWGRVFAAKILRTCSKLSFPWLENLITIVKLVRDGSSAVPIPYIRSAAAIILDILEVIQVCLVTPSRVVYKGSPQLANRNEEDFKELANDLVSIIETMQTTLTAHCSGSDPPAAYMSRCEEFIMCVISFLCTRRS
jgi:hypothetical protein